MREQKYREGENGEEEKNEKEERRKKRKTEKRKRKEKTPLRTSCTGRRCATTSSKPWRSSRSSTGTLRTCCVWTVGSKARAHTHTKYITMATAVAKTVSAAYGIKPPSAIIDKEAATALFKEVVAWNVGNAAEKLPTKKRLKEVICEAIECGMFPSPTAEKANAIKRCWSYWGGSNGATVQVQCQKFIASLQVWQPRKYKQAATDADALLHPTIRSAAAAAEDDGSDDDACVLLQQNDPPDLRKAAACLGEASGSLDGAIDALNSFVDAASDKGRRSKAVRTFAREDLKKEIQGVATHVREVAATYNTAHAIIGNDEALVLKLDAPRTGKRKRTHGPGVDANGNGKAKQTKWGRAMRRDTAAIKLFPWSTAPDVGRGSTLAETDAQSKRIIVHEIAVHLGQEQKKRGKMAVSKRVAITTATLRQALASPQRLNDPRIGLKSCWVVGRWVALFRLKVLGSPKNPYKKLASLAYKKLSELPTAPKETQPRSSNRERGRMANGKAIDV